MPSVLSHPFRIGPDGRAAVVEDGTDQAHAEAIAVHLLTRQGERELVPEFGTPDPVFGEVTAEALNTALDTFGPPVTVTAVTTVPTSDTSHRVDVTYEED